MFKLAKRRNTKTPHPHLRMASYRPCISCDRACMGICQAQMSAQTQTSSNCGPHYSYFPPPDKNTGLCYALDESLAAQHLPGHCDDNVALAAAMQGPGLAALVLKPTLIGGFGRCISLHRRAPVGTEVCVGVPRRSFLSLAFGADVSLQGACTVCWMDGSHYG